MEFARTFVDGDGVVIERLIFAFTAAQVGSLARLVIYESNQTDITDMSSRFLIIIDAARQRYEAVFAALNVTVGEIQSASLPVLKETARELLMRLYLVFPAIVRSMYALHINGSLSTLLQSSHADKIIHQHIRLLLNAATAHNAFTALRSIAASNPSLVMRYVPVLGALVDARAGVSPTEFVTRQHHRVLIHVLGILDALRPSIFDSSDLEEVLNNCFALLESTDSFHKPLLFLISKLADFLAQYISLYPGALSTRLSLLTKIAELYPEVKKLGLVCEMLKQPHMVPVEQTAVISSLEISATRAKLAGAENVVTAALQELDKSSLRTATLLRHFVTDLSALTMHHLQTIREISHKLLLRHIQQSSQDESALVSVVLACLRHPNPEVVSSALSFVVEYFQFANGTMLISISDKYILLRVSFALEC